MATVVGDFNFTSDYTNTVYTGTGGTSVDSFSVSTKISFPSTSVALAYSYVADGTTHNALLAAGASLTLTLSALTGPNGTIAFTTIRKFLLWNQSATEKLVIGSAASHPWTGAFSGTITVPPGGFLAFGGPTNPSYAVTSGSSDQLKIDASAAATAVPFTLEILGS